MTRRKVKMGLISNDSERKNCYKKRKQSLLKLTGELSTLCGIDAGIIVYSQYDAEAQIWPSESKDVENILEKFSTYPAWKKIKNKVDQDMYMSQRIAKARERTRKVAKENKEKEAEILMLQCLGSGVLEHDNKRTVADLNILSSVIDQTLKDLNARLETLTMNEMTSSSQPQMQLLSSQSEMQTQTPVASQFKMLAVSHQPQLQAPMASQSEMLAPVAHQPQLQAPMASQSEMLAPVAHQPQLQAPVASQSVTLTPVAHQPQLQAPVASQSEMLAPVAHQPQLQTLVASESEMLAPVAHQPQLQTPAISQAEVQTIVPEVKTVQNDGRGLDVSNYSMEDQWLMYLSDGKWED